MWSWYSKTDWVNYAFGVGLLIGLVAILILSVLSIIKGIFPWGLIGLVIIVVAFVFALRLESPRR